MILKGPDVCMHEHASTAPSDYVSLQNKVQQCASQSTNQ